MSKQKTILIFYIKSGGGHESAAKAIKSQFQEFNHNIILIDMLAQSPKIIQNHFDKGYVNLVENQLWLWLILNKMWSFRIVNLFSYWSLSLFTKKFIRKQIKINKPDMILSTYFFGEKISEKILENEGVKIPNFTIVSEIFDAPKIWFTFPGNYIVFSKLAKKIATLQTNSYKSGSKIIEFGYFFNSVFNTLIPKNPDKNDKKFSVLVLGGGSSLPNGDKLLSKILEIDRPVTINLVCGRNQELFQKCTQIKALSQNSKVNLTIWPFTDQIPDLIANCDLIITKGGPAVIFESLSQIKPILIYDYIKPQEKGNVDFVIKNNFGFFEPDFQKLNQSITQIIDEPSILDEYIQRIRLANIKSSSPKLIEFLQGELEKNIADNTN